ncbi:RYamide receptor [Gryllus bimaculatus]|nr:RYamide receptor [Gryllus bimaculatus]
MGLTTDEFRFCCLARHVAECYPPPDEFSSCEDLMSNLVLRVCVWVLGVIATVGNGLVIAWRMHFKHTNQVHSFLITNLAIGDLFMGSYLLIIASVDAKYRGVYFIHDSTWRSSELCSLAVITLDRFLVIIFPFRVRRLEMPKTRLVMAAGWFGAALLSGLPLLQFDYFRNFYGRSGVCLALHITPEKPSGWEYSVFVFLFLNLVSFSIIALGYVWMYAVARTTRQAVCNKEQRPSDAAMARRMTLIVATDAACWMPIILLGALSLGGITVPTQKVLPYVTGSTCAHSRYDIDNAVANNLYIEMANGKHVHGPLLDKDEEGEVDQTTLFALTKQNHHNSQRWRSGSYHSRSTSAIGAPSLGRANSCHHTIDTAVSARGEIIPLRRLSPDRHTK